MSVDIENEIDSRTIIIFDKIINPNRYFKYPEQFLVNPFLIHSNINLYYGLNNYYKLIYENNPNIIEEDYSNLNSLIETYLNKENNEY